MLVIDAFTADASAAPVDLKQSATTLGCATKPIFPVGCITLTVDDVVSTREFVVTGRYGRERVRPWLEPGTVIQLERLRAHEGEIVEGLNRELKGRRLLEPASTVLPPVTGDGLRIVGLWTTDLETLDSVVTSMLARFPDHWGIEPSPGDVDLAVVPRDSASLQEQVRAAVAEAERASAFRAPSDLVVEWGDTEEMGDALLSALEHPDACLDVGTKVYDESGREVEFEPHVEVEENTWGISLPGGRILIDDDREWRALDLHWVLLHELMHQHQYALCAAGLELNKVPSSLRQAHATSLALEILQHEGLSKDELAFVRENDVQNGTTRAFDELRAELGLDADDLLRRIATDPDLAWRIRLDLEGPVLWNNMSWNEAHPWGFPRDVPNAGLSFECAPAEGLITIANSSDSAFSGSTDGWWYSTSAGPDALKRQRGDAPFALRLPPGGRVTLKTDALPPDADPASCFTIFRRTPAPVFGPSESERSSPPTAP